MPCYNEQVVVALLGGQVVALPGQQIVEALLGLVGGEGSLEGLGHGCLEFLMLEQVFDDRMGCPSSVLLDVLQRDACLKNRKKHGVA